MVDGVPLMEVATTDRYTCPVCGVRDDAAGDVLVVLFDEDVEGVRRLLQPAPLDSACSNCGEVHRLHSGLVFVSTATGVAVVHGEELDVEAVLAAAGLADDPGLMPEVHSDEAAALGAVRRHLATLADEALLPFQVARADDEVAAWAQDAALSLRRQAVSAAVVVTPLLVAAVPETSAELEEQLADTVAELVAYRALATVLHGFDGTGDLVAALDDALLPSIVPGGALGRLGAVVLHGQGASAEVLAAAVALAWWFDAVDEAIPTDVASRWRSLALSWASAPRGPTGETGWPLAVPLDLIRRTIPSQQVRRWIEDAAPPGAAGRLMSWAVETGLVDAAELLESTALPEEARADLVEQARAARADELAPVLIALASQGWLDEVAAVMQARLPEVAGTALGVSLTREVVEMLWRDRRAARALALASDFLDLVDERPSAWMPPTEGVALLNELGNVARQLRRHGQAMTLYQEARDLLPRSDHRATQRPVLLRNIAIIERETGRPAAARALLTEVLDGDLEPRRRAETLESLALCLLQLGEHRAAALATAEAVDLAEHDGRDRGLVARMLLAAAQAASYDDDHAGAHEYAGRGVVAADALGDAYLSAAAATLTATSAVELDLPEAADEVAAAFTRVEQARADVLESELLDRLLATMTVRLRWATGEVDAMLATIADEELDDWNVGALAASALLEAGRPDEAATTAARAWTELLTVLAGDDVAAQDAVALRNARLLQDVTTQLALRALAAGDPAAGLELLRASELRANLLGALTTWPSDRRLEAADLLGRPAELLRVADPGMPVVLALDDADGARVLVARDADVSLVGSWEHGTLDAVRAEVAAATRRGAADGEPLAACPRWAAFSTDLGARLEPLLDGASAVLLLAVEALHGLPMHMVPVAGEPLCLAHPCVYGNSLLQVAGMRARVAAGRFPGRAGVVTVPRSKDRPGTRAVFEAAALRWSEVVGGHAEQVQTLVGPVADRAAVLALLAGTDTVLVACHGQGQPGYGRHGLLVAYGGQLPPVLMGTSADSSGRRFLLSWEELAGRSPAVVVSAACSSGSSSFALGGERVSVDRALVEGGTAVFFGPMWDVGVRHGLELAVGLVRHRLDGAPSWAHAWQALLHEMAPTTPAAAWQSFTLTGDWRY